MTPNVRGWLIKHAALDAFSAGMDAATHRVSPDDGKRPRADELRDLVRQEVWRDFR